MVVAVLAFAAALWPAHQGGAAATRSDEYESYRAAGRAAPNPRTRRRRGAAKEAEQDPDDQRDEAGPDAPEHAVDRVTAQPRRPRSKRLQDRAASADIHPVNNRLDASIAPQPLPAPESQQLLTVHGRSADRIAATGPPRFLFLDAEQRSTLAAVRAAARYGYRAAAAGSDRASLAHLSRACSDALVVPRPDTEPAAFVAALEEILDRDRYAGVITATEASLLALSEGRDRLAHLVPLGLPPHDVVVRCLDKVALAEAAAAVGAPTPTSIVCESPAAGIDALRQLGPPVVVKPATSLVRSGDDVWRQEGKFVSSEAELLRTHSRFGPRFIVQRLVSDAVLRSAVGGRRRRPGARADARSVPADVAAARRVGLTGRDRCAARRDA